MITKKDFERAPMWTIFHGLAEDPGPIKWALFGFEGYYDDVLAKMRELHVVIEEPEWDSAFEQPRDDVTDLDAALAYLREGGTLCKVPDKMNSKYWRLLVVEGRREGDKNSGGVAMLIKRTARQDRNDLVYIGGETVHVVATTSITRLSHPWIFPVHNFDPVGVHACGELATLRGVSFEVIKHDGLEVGVPRELTDYVRKIFGDGVMWRAGMTDMGARVYAVLKGEVVAVINDGVLTSW